MSRRPRRVAPSAPSRTRARRPAALCFGKDKPAEFQKKKFLGRNMRPDTQQESRQAVSVIKLSYLGRGLDPTRFRVISPTAAALRARAGS